MERQHLGSGAFTLAGFFSPAECARWIAASEALGYEDEAPISGPAGFEKRLDIRNNARVIADRPEWADEIWARLAPCVPAREGVEATGLNERFRFYRYDPGQRFNAHYDGYYQRPAGFERSLWTLLVYLNEDFEGGGTDLCEIGVSVLPRTGLALLFVHDQLHAGSAVVRGRKYVLRTDVMFRRAGGGRW